MNETTKTEDEKLFDSLFLTDEQSEYYNRGRKRGKEELQFELRHYMKKIENDFESLRKILKHLEMRDKQEYVANDKEEIK